MLFSRLSVSCPPVSLVLACLSHVRLSVSCLPESLTSACLSRVRLSVTCLPVSHVCLSVSCPPVCLVSTCLSCVGLSHVCLSVSCPPVSLVSACLLGHLASTVSPPFERNGPIEGQVGDPVPGLCVIFPVGDAFEWTGATDVTDGQTQPHREEQKPAV